MADRLRPLAALLACGVLAACSGTAPIDIDDLSDPQRLQEARDCLAKGDLDRAEDAVDALLEHSTDPKLKQEGLFLAGEIQYADHAYKKAFRHYQELLHDFPWSPFLPKCEDHVYEIGVYYLSNEPWLFFHDLFSGREFGAEVMREFAASFPSSTKADDALAALGEYRYSRKEYEQAASFYAQLARKHPLSEWGDLAAFRRAESWMLAARGPAYDVTPLVKASRNYRRYLSERPNGERREQAQKDLTDVDEQLAHGELLKAEVYVARENEPGARLHYANVALAFPQTKAAETAREALTRNGWDLSINSIDTLALPPGVELDE